MGPGIVDLSGISLETLRSMWGPAMSESLESLMEDMDDPYSVRMGGSSPSQTE
jgi:hypothetical protein